MPVVSILFLVVIAVVVLVIGAVIFFAVSSGGEGGAGMTPVLLGCGVLAGLGVMAGGVLLVFGISVAPAGPMPAVAPVPPVTGSSSVVTAVAPGMVDVTVAFSSVPKGATKDVQQAFTKSMAQFDSINGSRSSSSSFSAGPLHVQGTLNGSVTPSPDTDAVKLQEAIKAFSQALNAELAGLGIADKVTVTINNTFNAVAEPDVSDPGAPAPAEPEVH